MKMSQNVGEGGGPLCHEDVQICQKTLAGMNAFRKCGKLCDVTLEVEGHNVPAHRIILACSSTWLCEMLTVADDGAAPDDTKRHVKIHGVDYDSLHTLINFAYTGR
jgi:influenza virus NS1A-binding protein